MQVEGALPGGYAAAVFAEGLDRGQPPAYGEMSPARKVPRLIGSTAACLYSGLLLSKVQFWDLNHMLVDAVKLLLVQSNTSAITRAGAIISVMINPALP